MAGVGTGIGVHRLLEGIQRQVHRRVARAVDADLQAGIVQGAHSVLEGLRVPSGYVPTHTVVRLMAVGHLELAIQQELEASEAHEPISFVVFDLLQRPLQVTGPLQGVIDAAADKHFPRPVSVKVGTNGIRTAHVVVVESGDSCSGENRLRSGDVVAHHLRRGPRCNPPQHVHSAVVVENPRWLAFAVPLDHPADRVRCVGSDASDLERQAVGRTVVSTLLDHPERVMRRDGVQVMPIGEPVTHYHEISLHPFALGSLGNGLSQFGPHVVHGPDLRRHEWHVEVLQLSPDLQMVVGVNQAGGYRLPTQVNHLCFLADQGADGLVVAHGLDEPVFDSHRLGNGVGRVHGDDLSVEQHHVGGALGQGGGGNSGCRRGSRGGAGSGDGGDPGRR